MDTFGDDVERLQILIKKIGEKLKGHSELPEFIKWAKGDIDECLQVLEFIDKNPSKLEDYLHYKKFKWNDFVEVLVSLLSYL